MSVVRPFAGLRPPQEIASRLASPPYDVVNSHEARALAEGNPYSFLHISRPEIDLPYGTDEHSQEVYSKGIENLSRFRQQRILAADPSPCFYLYRQKMGEHSQIGLVGCVSVDEYQNGLIKKHELTRSDKEDDRTKHIDVLKANDEPVFLTYTARDSIDHAIASLATQKPVYDLVTEDGLSHTFWVVNKNSDIAELESEFLRIPSLYIADGHHRSAAASRVRELRKTAAGASHRGTEEYNFFLAVIFPHNQLNIMAYNRLVKDLNGLSSDEFKAKLQEKFTLTTSAKAAPSRQHYFGMYLDGAWYSLAAKDNAFDADDPVSCLDVSVLQDNVLGPILGIDNPRTNKRIDFVGGIRGTNELEKRVDSREFKVAFAMYPTGIDQLMAISDAGKIMPPKSTWFEPKLRSGLVIHEF